MSEVGALVSSGVPPSTGDGRSAAEGADRFPGGLCVTAQLNTQDSVVSAQDGALFHLKPVQG